MSDELKWSDIATQYREYITCPYCGYEHEHSYEVFDIYDSECKELDCSNCDKPFQATIHKQITYSTKPI